MKRIIPAFRGHYRELVLGPLFKLFEAVLELLVPLVMAGIIDEGIARGDSRYIITRGLLMLLLGALGVGAAMICQYFAAVVAGHVGRNLRNETYRHVLSLSGRDVAPFGADGLITRLTNDINQIQHGVNMAIRLATRAPFLAIGGIIMALRINLRIGVIFLISTPVIILVLYVIMRRTLPSYGRIQAGQDGISRLATENLSGVRVIRAFSRQEDEIGQFDAAGDALTRLTVRVGKISAALNPLTSMIVNVAIIAIIWLGARTVFAGRLLTGEVIALVNYMNQTLLALVVAANLVVLFTRALASAQRVSAVLAEEPVIAAPAEARPVPDTVPDGVLVRVQDVSFAYYDGADSALEGISFTIPQGKTVGVIGGTGSGKSTLVSLLMRYYDVTEGAISYAGEDIRTLDPAALRRQIGLAPQKATLFAGTIRRNLQMAAPGATEEAMWHALEVAQGADFVRAMEGGLDAVLEEGGKNLSGGQRQRLTVARALVRSPRLLVLDDSASALDYATDAALRVALAKEKQARPEMSVLLISQRAASLRGADAILVLDDGRLVGHGAHDVLAQKNEIYRDICRSQGVDIPAEGGGRDA